MTDLEHWHAGNEAHLSASLGWLRLRFAQLFQRGEDGVAGALDAATSPAPLKVSWWKSGSVRHEDLRTKHPKEDPAQLQQRLAQAAQTMAAAAQATDPPPALIMLTQRFGLSSFEQQLLLLCAAMELDPQMAPLCAHAHGDPSKAFPTFALALSLFEDPSWDALSPERPLRYWKFLEIHQPGALPLTASPCAWTNGFSIC